MATTCPFSHLFDVNVWNLQDDRTVDDLKFFMCSFTDAIIRPNSGQDAPPDQASAFIELVADPRVLFVVQIAMRGLLSNDGVELAEQNPWIWAIRSVTRPFPGENSGSDAQRPTQPRMVNTLAVVIVVLNVLQSDAGVERRREINAVKRVFAMRLVGLMPR
ncbi:MAG: hypothetical protein ASARMPRED_000039 [Alectoria sarmentosa]|nr:MAG: hypothetical protein ASARMPRED_000039 [Alectoria sarmentosa]